MNRKPLFPRVGKRLTQKGVVYLPDDRVVLTRRNEAIGIDRYLLDTLAQLPEAAPSKAGGGAKPKIITAEKRSKESILYKRCKSKYITDAIAIRLSELDSPLKKAYCRTLDCSSFMMQEGKVMTSKYCNGRWCLTCNRIRTAKLMNGYLPQIEKWENKYFVTLTVPNVTDINLRYTMILMYRNFRTIKREMSRNKKVFQYKGLRKLESTHNEFTGEYHPHFHLMINNRRAALKIISMWLDAFPMATMAAQDIRRADNHSVKELFKYSTKLVVKSKKQKGNTINAKALDVIFNAMYGLRTFQPLGIKKITEDVEHLQSQEYLELQNKEPGDPTIKIWKWYGVDWCHEPTGEILTGHKPTLNAHSIVNNEPDYRPPKRLPVPDKPIMVDNFEYLEEKFFSS